jgi:hypothetical protein
MTSFAAARAQERPAEVALRDAEVALGWAEVDERLNRATNALLAESLWCCYAFPVTFGQTGRRAFFISQHGDMLFTTNTRQQYGSAGSAPVSYAARARGTYNYMSSTIATNTTGWDLQQWSLVN